MQYQHPAKVRNHNTAESGNLEPPSRPMIPCQLA